LSHIFHAVKPTCVLADQDGLVAARPVANCPIIELDSVPRNQPSLKSVSGADPEDTAIVIQTSGTTGVPKSILIPHRGLLNTALWWAYDGVLTPMDRVLCTVGTAFDPASFDTFRALSAGAE